METSNHDNDIISIKGIILTAKEYAIEVLRQWKLILLFALLFGGLFFVRNKLEVDSYGAKLTFMLEDNDSSGSSSLSGLLGSFGLGNSGKGLNRDKLIELSKSNRIIQEALLKRVSIGEAEDFLANHLIRIYGYDEKWAEKETNSLNGFQFTHDSLDLFEVNEHKVLKSLRSKMLGSPASGVPGILSSSYNMESGILYLKANSLDPELSIIVVEKIYEVLDSFFVTNTVEKQKRNFEIIKYKTDSLRADIQATEYALAKFKDSGRNLFRKVDQLEESRLANKLKISYMALGKAIENKEIADYTLKYQTPLLSIIDRPFLPLYSQKQPFLPATILGLVFGCILGTFFVVIRKKFLEIMAN